MGGYQNGGVPKWGGTKVWGTKVWGYQSVGVPKCGGTKVWGTQVWGTKVWGTTMWGPSLWDPNAHLCEARQHGAERRELRIDHRRLSLPRCVLRARERQRLPRLGGPARTAATHRLSVNTRW